MSFKTMKVFDCEHMPKDVRKQFFSKHNKSNDCAVEECVFGANQYAKSEAAFDALNINSDELIYKEVDTGGVYYILKGDDIVSEWLLENGAEMFEDVMVKHWW